MLEFIALGLLGISVIIALGDAYRKRGWPRDTIQFVIVAGIALAVVLQVLHC